MLAFGPIDVTVGRPVAESEVDKWPAIRRYIEDLFVREKEAGIFPSIVFQRFDHLQSQLKETFAGFGEATSQLARDHVLGIVEQHFTFRKMHSTTQPTPRWGTGRGSEDSATSGRRSSARGKQLRR